MILYDREVHYLIRPQFVGGWQLDNCNPGVLCEVLEYFEHKLKTEASAFSYLIDVALIYDAMSIRDGFWPDQNGKVYGYCDLGGIAHRDTEELAK